MNKNIVLVGLDYATVKSTANDLSASFDMFYMDINDLIKYNFKNKEETISKVGVEYFNNQVKKIVSSTSDYENTIINCPYDLIIDTDIQNRLKKSAYLFLLDIPKEVLIDLNKSKQANEKLDVQIIAYEELTKELANISDYVVKYNKDVKNIIEDIKKVFEVM